MRRCRAIFARVQQAGGIAGLRGERLLDIGCDTGAFLEAARQEFSIDPVGLDTASRAVAAARQQGIDAYLGTIEQAPEHLRDFKAITAIDLIEHVSDPAGFLRGIYKRLRPGGVLYLETPNIESLVYRIGQGLAYLFPGGSARILERLFPPQHVQYFTGKSLENLARRAGFEVMKIDNRVLPSGDIAASLAVRMVLSAVQVLDRWTGRRILIWAVLRRPVGG